MVSSRATGLTARRFGGALRAGLASLGLFAAAPLGAGQVAFPLFDSAGSTLRVFTLDLSNGRLWSLESRRSGEAFRVSLLQQNLFSTIGRPVDQPAGGGEFVIEGVRDRGARTRAYLLAETTTGYLAYLGKLTQGNSLGELRTVPGRPLTPLVGTDGQYALLMRQDASRRSDLGYFLHTSTGDCLLLDGVDKVEANPSVRPCGRLPAFRLGSNVIPQRTGSGTTTGYLVIDEADSALLLIGYSAEGVDKLILTRTEARLGELFPPTDAKSSGRRFSLAPLQDDDGTTTAAVVFDRLTGRLAVLSNLAPGARIGTRLLPGDLTGRFANRSDLMEVEAVPRESAGRTMGVWLVGERGRQALWVSGLTSPEGPVVSSVEIRE